jgi:hypothetical protein
LSADDLRPRLSAHGIIAHLRGSLPHLRESVIGALCWGAAMALSMWLGLWFRNRAISGKADELDLIFFAGAAIAWPFIMFVASFLARGRGVALRLAISAIVLMLGTSGMTALIFSQQYRHFYAQWHARFASVIWVFQFTETSLSAVYQFAVLGLGLYFPLGYAFLMLATLWLMRRLR